MTEEISASPGTDAAAAARRAIDEALLLVVAIAPPFDRAGVSARLAHAVACSYAVLDTALVAPAHHDGLTEAAAMVREARALLGRVPEDAAAGKAIEALDLAISALVIGAEAVARHQIAHGRSTAPPPPARPFRASVGTPALHALVRRPMVPELEPADPAPAPPPPPKKLRAPETLEALAAFAAAGASGALERKFMAEPAGAEALGAPALIYAYEPAIEDAELLRRLARDCLEDIAIYRDLRKPNAIETWLDQAPFEQRLLDNLDCFASLGSGGLPLVSLYFAEAKAPDPGRAFAVALTLGCIEGKDTVDAAIWTLKQAAPETHPGFVEGFALASNPEVDAALVPLVKTDLGPVALAALIERRSAPLELVADLARSQEPLLFVLAVRGLGLVGTRAEASAVLDLLLATHDDDALLLPALEAAMRRGHAPARALLRRAIDDDARRERADEAAWLLCLGGTEADIEPLLARMRRAPSARLARGLGRFGHPAALPLLVELCDSEFAPAAAEALERITGAGMRETIEESWEFVLPKEAQEAGALPVPTRKVEKVVTDPAHWREWLRRHARRFDHRERVRAGEPWRALALVDELEAAATPPLRRPEAELELAIATGITGFVRTDDWVARQRERLGELRERVRGLSLGGWPFGAARDSVPAAAAAHARLGSTVALSLADLPAFGAALPEFVGKSAGAAPAGGAPAKAAPSPELPFKKAPPAGVAPMAPAPLPDFSRFDHIKLDPKLPQTLDVTSPQPGVGPAAPPPAGPLPFHPPSSPPPTAPVPTGTATAGGDALPFKRSASSAPPPAPAAAQLPPQASALPVLGTAPSALPAAAPSAVSALPFARPAASPTAVPTPPAVPAATRPAADGGLPFKRQAAPATRLTLDEYASIEAELSLEGADPAVVTHRYGFQLRAFELERAGWHALLSRDANLRGHYQAKVKAFRDWLLRKR